MSLAKKLAALGADTVRQLDRTHDHYTYTRKVWRLVGADVVRYRRRFSFRNPQTGNAVDQDALVALSRDYLSVDLPQATIQSLVSTFEVFAAELLHAWFAAHPKSIAAERVELAEILSAGSVDEMKAAAQREAIERKVLKLMYERPTKWFAALGQRVLAGYPTPDEVDRFLELKATRDVIAHNRGIANATYVEKSGSRARHAVGETVELGDAYIQDSWRLIRGMVGGIASKAASAAPN